MACLFCGKIGLANSPYLAICHVGLAELNDGTRLLVSDVTSDMVHLLCKDVAMLITGRPATLGLALLGRIDLICWTLLCQARL